MQDIYDFASVRLLVVCLRIYCSLDVYLLARRSASSLLRMSTDGLEPPFESLLLPYGWCTYLRGDALCGWWQLSMLPFILAFPQNYSEQLVLPCRSLSFLPNFTWCAYWDLCSWYNPGHRKLSRIFHLALWYLHWFCREIRHFFQLSFCILLVVCSCGCCWSFGWILTPHKLALCSEEHPRYPQTLKLSPFELWSCPWAQQRTLWVVYE